jgi:hypothetical protein
MTRKKFIKQLMACGFSRNSANAVAYACMVAGEPYGECYRRKRPWLGLAKAARQLGAYILNLSKGVKDLIPCVEKLRDNLVLHHPRPINPGNMEAGNLYIVTQQEHNALHGYSAKVSFVDELETAGGGQL